MNTPLSVETQRMIEDRTKRGDYPNADELVRAALAALSQREADGDFESGEWERLLEDGEKSGAPLHGEQVLAELRDLRNRK